MEFYYRAAPIVISEEGEILTESYLRSGDYITKSRKFAKEHAETSSVYHQEDYGVYYFLLSDKEVVPAYNPGEYKYKQNTKIPKNARLSGYYKYNEDRADASYIIAHNIQKRSMLELFFKKKFKVKYYKLWSLYEKT